MLGAVSWMIDHPERGVLVPDDLPWEDVLKVAGPYLGSMHSDAADWDPLTTRYDPFKGWNGRAWDDADPWQFTNFLV